MRFGITEAGSIGAALAGHFRSSVILRLSGSTETQKWARGAAPGIYGSAASARVICIWRVRHPNFFATGDDLRLSDYADGNSRLRAGRSSCPLTFSLIRRTYDAET